MAAQVAQDYRQWQELRRQLTALESGAQALAAEREQLDWQALHRVRDRLVQRRTALINEIRGFLLERGITFAAQPIHLRKNLPAVIEDAEQNLSPRLRWLLDRMWQEWKQIEIDVAAITEEIERISNDDARCRQLRQIPDFGQWTKLSMRRERE